MLANLNLPPKFAVALDPDFIRALSERAAGMRVTRRTCRPLETRPSRNVEIDVSTFDSQIDAEDLAEGQLPEEISPAVQA